MLETTTRLGGSNPAYLVKQKGYTVINILGLALGLACFGLLMLFVSDERSFDRFHEDSDRLFRVNKIVTPQDGGVERHALTGGLVAAALEEQLPEVELATKVLPWFNELLLRVGEEGVVTNDVVFADTNFFSYSISPSSGRPGRGIGNTAFDGTD